MQPLTESGAMRILIIILLLLSAGASASEFTLVRGKDYVVPDGKIWIIKSASVAECGVCTADVYVQGEISNVEIAGVVFHGNFDFSINNSAHNEIKLYPGTRISLGDT